MSEELREKLELEKLWALGTSYDDQTRAMLSNSDYLYNTTN